MTTSPAPWCLVVPIKRLAAAKSRLAGLPATARADLALAFALDTVEAALRCPDVCAVVVVTGEPRAAAALTALGARVVADPDAGLNVALSFGARASLQDHADCGIGALAADLPALRPIELSRALRAASAVPASFVADAAGTGTTLLLARTGESFRPQFGPGSAGAHERAGAVRLRSPDLTSLRCDVDTETDLADSRGIGLGPRTTEVLARTSQVGWMTG